MMGLKALVATFLFASTVISSPIKLDGAEQDLAARSTSSSWWLPNLQHQGVSPFAPSGYTVYRDVVKDFGADPTGNTDSTAAINNAIASGNRCGQGCDSTTTLPAVVYFPPGTYLVSAPIIQYYYTQLIGDAINPPTLKAAPSFTGMAVIDSDPYTSSGANWYVNQNNFYRQVRNFVIDLTAMPQTSGAGIHWQVAQATSLQNIVFNMIPGSGSKQLGIFMDNGSGGFMSDLTFNGGQYGAFFGSQQFTTRNLVFNNCQTAIFMNWNWGWTMAGVTVNNCGIGLDMSNGATSTQTVGSVAFIDSTINNTPIGIKTAFTSSTAPVSAGTLFVDNVNFVGTPIAIANANNGQILAGNTLVTAWGQGQSYTQASGSRVQQTMTGPTKSGNLLDSNGRWYTQSKPQYTNVPASSFVSIRSFGAKGDGSTDDTAAFQQALSSVSTNQILYINYGVYIISSTVTLPPNIKIVGEHWANILCTGSKFQDQNNPVACLQVGTAGQSGSVQIQDLVIGTQGPAPGAILMEWNLASAQGQSGAWDVHFRVGGFTGSNMQSTTCVKNPSTPHGANPSCIGSFLLFHATPSSSGIYLENNWLWVADHELDIPGNTQIDIYNGRGLLIESPGPTWVWGGAVEHSTLYNYQLYHATDVFMGFIQSETPYFQTNPVATIPFTPQPAWHDPALKCVKNPTECAKAFGLRILGSSNVYIYGSGLYSWFENYSQDCLTTGDCQKNMVQIKGGSSAVWLYAATTIASVNMISQKGQTPIKGASNMGVYGDTILNWNF